MMGIPMMNGQIPPKMILGGVLPQIMSGVPYGAPNN